MQRSMTDSGERAYATIDKAAWGSGVWLDEPDKVQWVDEATGLDCLAVRQPRAGHWCGYVGVPPEHPLHGAGYDDVRVRDDDGDLDWPRVHGGLTFASRCQEGEDESVGVCHVPLLGRPHDVWWLGFDCAHSGDLSPGYLDYEFSFESYRDLRYVRAETARLAGQLVRGERAGEEA